MLTTSSVPQFPTEDEKLRATNISRRRGGNTANSLEVLSQLLPADNFDSETSTYSTELSLVTVLPDQRSSDTQVVISSLPDVSPRLYLYREGEQVAASSYIIQSAEKLTRTIVSANPLKDMTVDEFKGAIKSLIPDYDSCSADVWVHFEGRIPDVTLQCVNYLRERFGYHGKVKISVECEKPDRKGMKNVAALADVVFYSKIWAQVRESLSYNAIYFHILEVSLS
jgi:ketohexokinase